MSIGFIAGLAIAAVGAVCAIAAVRFFVKKNKAVGAFLAACVVVLAIAFVLVPMSFHTVDAGEVAVVKYLGQAKDVRPAGTHFDLWVTNTYQIYDAKVQNVDIKTVAYSSDAQTMDIQLTLQYQIMGEKVIDIANQYGSLEILENRIQSIAIEKTKAVLSQFKAMDIIADRASMSPAVEVAIKDAVGEDYFVNVNTVVLTNIDFSDAFEQAVEEKMIAEQKQLKAEYENQTKIAQAEAEAKAKVLEAEAEAKANELLEQSLTDKILQEMYISKWDGKMPSVMTGDGGANVMIPLEDLAGEKAE